jgi:ankyrin repeat protein
MKHILLHCHENFGGIIVGYFFNVRGDKLEKTLMGMLRSFLYQLLEVDPTLREPFIAKYLDKVKKHGKEWEWTVGELQNFLLLETKRGQIKPLLLLVDALDECDDLEVQKAVEFLEELSISAIKANVALHICLSSRHYPTIDMKSRLELKIEDQEQHDRDIIKYVGNKLRVRDKMIEEELLRRAKHVFLWVVLVVEMLNHAFERGNTRAMQKKLQEVPSDLDGIFFTILQKDGQDKEATLLMFQWVLFAKRPLNPEELYFAVMAGIEPEELSARNHQRETDEVIRRYITSISKGLIEIRKGKRKTVQFIHESVNDFLLRNKRLQTLQAALQQYPVGASHDRLAACCMAYIKMKDLDLYASDEKLSKMDIDPVSLSNSSKVFSAQFPFTEYAARYVLAHAEMAQAGCISQQLYVQWLRQGNFKRLKTFHNAFYTSKYYAEDLIYALSLESLYELAKIILQDSAADVNLQGGHFGTALQAASYNGSREVVSMLLEKGADVNLQGGEFGTALQAASYCGHIELVALLLEKGADVNLQGGHFRTALQAASYNGSKEVVSLLLKKGADVNLQGGRLRTALQAASYNGSKEVVSLLLEKGADVNLQGGQFATALQAASYNGSKEVVSLLLENGADVNLQGGHFGTALQAASWHGSREIVSLLLENRAHINLQGGYYGSALQAASWRGSRDVVSLLLENRADVNLQGGHFGTALQAASYNGSKEVVSLLLENGADVNLQGGEFGTALQAASCRGHIESVALLLENGADINLLGGYLGTALQAASYKGRKDVVVLLLKNGADVNVLGGKYGNALQAALSRENREVVTLLREYGSIEKQVSNDSELV